MSVFARWSAGIENRDAEALAACLHEEFVFVRHQSGTTLDRASMVEMLRGFMASEDVQVLSQNCLYENDEVMVEHSLMNFADGTREAVLSCNRLKDGLICRTETGATPVAR